MSEHPGYSAQALCHKQTTSHDAPAGGMESCPAHLVDNLDDTTWVGNVLHHHGALGGCGVLHRPEEEAGGGTDEHVWCQAAPPSMH